MSQWYPPEQAPIGYMIQELAEALVANDHDVTVITGFPNHPGGIVYEGYKKRWSTTEFCKGVKVQRVFLYTKPNPGKLARVLTFLSFTFTSAWALLTNPRADLVFALFQPLSVGLTLPILAKLKRFKLVLNVQDLHPDVPIELGIIRNSALIKFLRWVERFGYGMSDGLAVICEGFKVHCVDKGAESNNVRVIPNWIDANEITPSNRLNDFRASMGFSDEHIVVLYAGTIGLVSGAEVVIQAAAILENQLPLVRFVFVGEGPAVKSLKKEAALRGLANVSFANFQPREFLSQVQAMSDISLVTLLSGKGRTSVPSKVLGYMAAARPIVASVDRDSETALLIRSAGCGLVVPSEDATALANAVSSLVVSMKLRPEFGFSGRKYLEMHFKKEVVIGEYIQFFENVVK